MIFSRCWPGPSGLDEVLFLVLGVWVVALPFPSRRRPSCGHLQGLIDNETGFPSLISY